MTTAKVTEGSLRGAVFVNVRETDWTEPAIYTFGMRGRWCSQRKKHSFELNGLNISSIAFFQLNHLKSTLMKICKQSKTFRAFITKLVTYLHSNSGIPKGFNSNTPSQPSTSSKIKTFISPVGTTTGISAKKQSWIRSTTSWLASPYLLKSITQFHYWYYMISQDHSTTLRSKKRYISLYSS